MANGHSALELMNKIEAEAGKQISDGLFDALVYLIDDAWSRGNRAGMEAPAKIADTHRAGARYWKGDGEPIVKAIVAAIREAIPKERQAES